LVTIKPYNNRLPRMDLHQVCHDEDNLNKVITL